MQKLFAHAVQTGTGRKTGRTRSLATLELTFAMKWDLEFKPVQKCYLGPIAQDFFGDTTLHPWCRWAEGSDVASSFRFYPWWRRTLVSFLIP